MGYLKHHAIVVSSWRKTEMYAAHEKANDIFGKVSSFGYPSAEVLVSDMMTGIANEQYTFFIAPDGSKEGWEPSNDCDDAREEFLNWLRDSQLFVDYVQISFGGDFESDNEGPQIDRSKVLDFGTEADQ